MSTPTNDEFTVHLPPVERGELGQDQEYFEIDANGCRRRLRFHDYADIYAIPGLYEHLFADALDCRSPEVVVNLLRDTLADHGQEPGDLRVVDFGAGNGMVAEELARIGAGSIVGVDELQEARQAAERDRPGIYDAYYAVDLAAAEGSELRELADDDFNCLTCVAALGFGDIPPEAFSAALDLVADEGWVAFNIRDRFAADGDTSGFAALLDDLTNSGELVEHARIRYRHRISLSGEPLHYLAMVAQKSLA